MKNYFREKLLALIILGIVLMAGATMAQIQGDEIINKEDVFYPLPPFFAYTGVEIAKGIYEPTSNMVYGNSFILHNPEVMDNNSELTVHHFTVSLNGLCEKQNKNVKPIIYENCNSIVKGGSWSLVVYRGNRYVGTLYGNVTSGNTNSAYGGSKKVEVKLQATGGVGIFAEPGSENMEGSFVATTDLQTKGTTGMINISCESQCVNLKQHKQIVAKQFEQ